MSDSLLEAFQLTEIQTGEERRQVCPPATINTELAGQVVRIAKLAYRALGLSGIATFDFIIKVSGVGNT